MLWSTFAPLHAVVLVWQLSQLVTPLWIAVLGLPTALRKPPVWHVAQLPVTAKLAWKRPLAQVTKLPLWQVSQLALATVAIDA